MACFRNIYIEIFQALCYCINSFLWIRGSCCTWSRIVGQTFSFFHLDVIWSILREEVVINGVPERSYRSHYSTLLLHFFVIWGLGVRTSLFEEEPINGTTNSSKERHYSTNYSYNCSCKSTVSVPIATIIRFSRNNEGVAITCDSTLIIMFLQLSLDFCSNFTSWFYFSSL